MMFEKANGATLVNKEKLSNLETQQRDVIGSS